MMAAVLVLVKTPEDGIGHLPCALSRMPVVSISILPLFIPVITNMNGLMVM
jgi:hypothetical protein